MVSKGKFKGVLEAKVLQRKGASDRVGKAALLYAQWQGWTEEADVDRQAAKTELNVTLDEMDEADWEGLKTVAQEVGDATFKGLVTYAVGRIAELNAENMRAMDTTIPIPQPRQSRRDNDCS